MLHNQRCHHEGANTKLKEQNHFV